MMSLPSSSFLRAALVVIVAFFLVGLWALRLQAAQARDTIRKHDLQDIEEALMRYSRTTGTFPPSTYPTWCGVLSDPRNAAVASAIETALRQDEKYGKPEKPFPRDPRFADTSRGYTYWKTSPVSFELLAELEADPNNTRVVPECSASVAYDYSTVSVSRNPF